MEPKLVFLRTTSHLSRERLERALGRKPEYWWTLRHDGSFAALTEAEAVAVLPLKGVTRTRIVPTGRCWKP